MDQSLNYAWTGTHDFSSATTVSGGHFQVNSGIQIRIGGTTANLSGNGTNVTLLNNAATGAIINKIGTSTDATAFRVVDSADE